ncbi:MAG: phosphotransferase [Candidatus Omnitrophica bacterium]|nr:phosphotransferase [Candidatus Omnitrophota bacterium]
MNNSSLMPYSTILKQWVCQVSRVDPIREGTAAPKYIVQTPAEKYLLKQRRREFCPPDVIRFDHSVILFLRKNGFPVALPEKTSGGERFFRSGEDVYELFEFVEGLEDFTPGDKHQIANAASTLGRIHKTLQNFSPDGKKPWRREFHPSLLKSELESHVKRLPEIFADRDIIKRVYAELEALIKDFNTAKLTHSIVHGDYTNTNVKFKNGYVGGIFDFDWTSYQNTLYDISRGIVFFCFTRNSPVDGSDIRSLVQPCKVDLSGTKVFMDAYRKEFTFTRTDAENLPSAIKEVILGARIRAMRKMPDSDKPAMLDNALIQMLDSINADRNNLINAVS